MAIGYVRGSLSQTGTTITLTSGGNKTIIATTSGAADKTVTLPAHNLAITTSAASSVTIPTSGTLISTDSSAAITGSMIASDTITNTNINSSAAIAYSKLNLGTSIVNADISGSAAIAYSKLNLATSIVNADLAAGAAIALSKLAALAVSKAVVTDGSGVLAVATTTAAELDYLSGVTGSIQTQIDGKVTKPGSAVDNHVVRLDGVDGAMQTSVVVINDGGNVSGVADLDISGNLNLGSSGSINKTAASLSIGASVGANNITLGGVTSTVVIPGNLEVQGDLTTINTTNTAVEDANIQINSGGTNGSASNAGLTITKGWDASTDSGLIWDTTAKRFKAGESGSEATVALTSDKLSAFATTTSAELAGVVSDETGSGSLVFATSPSLVTPSLGVATATSINSTTIPSSKTLVVTTDKLSALAATTSAELAGVISDETGSGALVFGTSPSIATPVLDKPVVNQVDVTQAASATTPAAGKSALYVSTGDSKLHVVDSSGNDVPVGSGSSGRNYFSDWNDSTKDIGTVTNSLGDTLASSDRTANKTTWGSSNTSLLTIAKSSDTSLRESTNYLITEAGSSSGAFIESPLVTLDGVDLGKPVSVRFDVTGNAADGDYQVYICRYDSSDVLQERIVVAGNASTTSPYSAKLPTGTTKFQGFFLASATSTDQYSIRIVSNNNSAASIRIDSLYVGPDTVVQGAAVSDWQAYTPTVTASGGGSVSIGTGGSPGLEGYWRRNGDSIDVRVRIRWGTTSTAFGSSGYYSFSLPEGITADSTKYGTSASFGAGEFYDNSAADSYPLLSQIVSNALTAGVAYTTTGGSVGTTFTAGPGTAITTANGDVIAVAAYNIAVVGWSSNVTMANRAVEEYAYNTTVTDAADSSSFGYGSTGSQFAAFTAARLKRVRFQTPILPTDKLFLEVTSDSGTTWMEPALAATAVTAFQRQNTLFYGMGWLPVNSTDVDVQFAQYRSPAAAAFGAAGNDWTAIDADNAYRWRMRKVSGGAVAGFPVGSRNIVGDTSGTTVPSGFIGEIKEQATAGAVAVVSSTYNVGGNAGISVGPGVWIFYTTSAYTIGTMTGVTRTIIGVSTDSGGFADSSDVNYVQTQPASYIPTGNFRIAFTSAPILVSTTATYYPKCYITATPGTATVSGYIRAVRIA